MRFVDLLAFYWVPLVSTLLTIATVFFLAWLLLRHITDDEIRGYIKTGRFILSALIIFGFVYSAVQTASVHLPRSTIDRSLSDEQQEALERRIYKEEGTPQ